MRALCSIYDRESYLFVRRAVHDENILATIVSVHSLSQKELEIVEVQRVGVAEDIHHKHVAASGGT